MSYSYETLYILRPDLTEEQVQQEVNKYRDFLQEYQTEDLKIKVWGKRRLAYPIKKQQDGVYVQMNYLANGKHVAPMERAMRLSDEVIRYLTLKLDKEDKEDKEDKTDKAEKVDKETVAPVPTQPVMLSPREVEVPVPVEEVEVPVPIEEVEVPIPVEEVEVPVPVEEVEVPIPVEEDDSELPSAEAE